MFHIWNLLGVAQKPPLTAPKGLLSKNSNCYAFEFVTSYLLLVIFQKLEFNWLPIDLSIIQRLFSRCRSATDHFADLILITWVSLELIFCHLPIHDRLLIDLMKHCRSLVELHGASNATWLIVNHWLNIWPRSLQTLRCHNILWNSDLSNSWGDGKLPISSTIHSNFHYQTLFRLRVIPFENEEFVYALFSTKAFYNLVAWASMY